MLKRLYGEIICLRPLSVFLAEVTASENLPEISSIFYLNRTFPFSFKFKENNHNYQVKENQMQYRSMNETDLQ